MLKLFKPLLDAYRAPSAAELAARELADAQRELLAAQSAREYADAMVSFNQRRVTRLQGALAAMVPAANDSNALRAVA